MIRTLECDNFLRDSGKITANIPEAWDIKITFQCLIGQSANMMLDGIIGGLNVETGSSTESGKK